MSEVLHGNASGDQLNASKDKTQVYGLAGNDTLISDRKSDALLVGGSGDDSLIMLGGKGTLSGGDGSDTFELNYSATEKISAVIEDLDPAKDKIVVNFDGNFALPILSVTSGDDVIWTDGANFNLTLKSVRENDYFDGDASDEAWEILKLTNDEREKENLTWLTMSDGLTEGAQIRAQEITGLAERGALSSHDRPDNKGGYSSIFNDVGKHYSHFGENLQAGAESSAEVLKDWIGSPSHYANIMNPDFLKLGVGYNYKDLSKNEYYWTQLFADSLNNPEIVSAEELSGVRPEGHPVRKFIQLTKRGDIYNNNEYGATIAALGGNDKITNTGLIASISGGKDDDIIDNSGSFVTINAGTGNDEINLSRGAKYNLIEYNIGDGSDTVSGLHSNDTLSISGYEYTPVTVGNDVIVSVGAGSIKLVDAPKTFTIAGVRSKFFLLTEGDDKLNNTVDGATIQAMGGDDKITISGENVLFVHESGDDTVRGFNDTSTLKVLGKNYSSITSGNDFILTNADKKSSITILNAASLNAINIVDANDRPLEVERVKNIIGTDDPDNLRNGSDDVTIQALGGDDTVTNKGDGVLIDGGADNDSISNDGSDVTIIGGGGSDTIKNTGDNNSILGGADDDTIEISGDENTINAEGGDDFISVKGTRNVIEYVAGGGSDVIEGFNQTSTLRISGDVYTSTTSNNDIVVTVGEQTISLVGAADLKKINIVGTSQIETTSSNYMDYNGHRYQLFDEGMTWEGAKAYCESLGGHLVVITDAAEQAAVEGLLKEKGTKNSYWLGGFKGGDDNSSTVGVSINNTINNTVITGTNYDDTIENSGSQVTITAQGGKDSIRNVGGEFVTIIGGLGDDSLYNSGDNITIESGAGNDNIKNSNYYANAENVTVSGGAGNDSIKNEGGNNVAFFGDADDDTLWNEHGSNMTLNGGEGADSIYNGENGEKSILDGGAGNDTITNTVSFVSISGGAGDDYITNYGSSVSIDAGIGNDEIENSDSQVTINGGAGNDSIYNGAYSATIDLGDGDDTIYNYNAWYTTINGGAGNDSVYNEEGDYATINTGAGNDSVYNRSWYSTISTGAGDDSIYNGYDSKNASISGGAGDDSIEIYSGDEVSINGGAGDDLISLSSASNNLIQYAVGDGNDTIYGFDDNDTLSISGATYSTTTSGNDVILTVGDGSIRLVDAASLSLNIDGEEDTTSGSAVGVSINNTISSTLITGTAYDDTIWNTGEAVTIQALTGNDSIWNEEGSSVTIDAGLGDDSISNTGANVSINGGAGNDSIWNPSGLANNTSISGGTGDDIIYNTYVAENVLINADEGNDSISNTGNYVLIKGGADNDSIENYGYNVSIDGGDGDDEIYNESANSVSINGGSGNDDISLDSSASDNVINYTSGDGSDTIYGFDDYDTLSIVGATYSTTESGDDVIVSVGDGSIRLINAASLAAINILNDTSPANVADDTTTPFEALDPTEVIMLTTGNDSLYNTVEGAEIQALAGDDTVDNNEANVIIYGGDDDDSIYNGGSNATIEGGDGNDSILNDGGNSLTIAGGAGNDSIYSSGNNISVNSGDGDDSIDNYGDNVTINSGSDNDDIYSWGNNVSISGGAGDDSIFNYVANSVTIAGGTGNDSISLDSSASNNVINYNSGDGNDTIWGFNDTSTLSISGAAYSTTTSGDDIIVSVGDGSISLVGAASLNSVNITSGVASGVTIDNSTSNTLVTGSAGDDAITNSGEEVTIQALGGNDTITNRGESVSIEGGEGDDSINHIAGQYVTINSGAGNDNIDNSGSSQYNDYITINSDTGNDSISNGGHNVTINTGDGNDTVENHRDWVVINGDEGADYITSRTGIMAESHVTINGGADNDTIINNNTYSDNSISGGAGDDSILNAGANSTLDGDTGNDIISLSSDAINNLIQYTSGEGDDTITGFNSTSTLSIAGAEYSTTTSGNDVIVTVEDGSITLKDAASLSALNIDGTLNSSGSWQWVTGETWSYDNWGWNQPDGDGSALMIYNSTGNGWPQGSWNDLNPTGVNGQDFFGKENFGLICEWETIPSSKLIELTEGPDTYSESMESDTTLKALGGNDYINNWRGDSVTIDLGADDDYILNHSSYVLIEGADGSDTVASWIVDDDTLGTSSAYNTIRGGAGDDSIDNHGHHALIEGNNGNDTINNYVGDDGGIHQGYEANYSTLRGGRGNDKIDNHGNHVLIEGGTGNDTIYNNNGAWFDDEAEYSTIYGGAGHDSIINHGASSIIDGANGNDSIHNYSSSVSIGGGADDDYIYNEGSQVSINGNAGDDSIDNRGKNDTILGGTGNDEISLSTASKNNFIRYADGDGNDTIWGATPDDTINILGVESYSSVKSGKNDLLIKVGNGSILLKDARNRPPKITLGESGSSGGTGGGMGGSGSGSGGSNSGGSNSSGGTSSSSNSNSAASGGNSASGSSGISSGLSGSSGRGSRISTQRTSATANPPAQTVRNQVLSNYQSGSKINSNEGHTGAFFDGKGNFYSGSTTGAIVIPDATNKLIDLRDAAGNPFIKAYRASNAGVIDGRSFAGFEIINGSAGSDEIYAGVNGSQITGGTGNDTLTGGRGIDIFVSGKAQGNDLIRNASLLDKISLTDVTLNDITSTRENDKTVSLTFRTGSVITVESKDILSPSFVLSDGSYFFYNSISKSWRVMNQASENQKVYGGGEQTISSYQSGEKILFNAEYRGGSYDGEGNFRVNSSAGSLVVQNATDKVIDLTNSAGNSIVKAYAASTSGVINGKDLTGYQIINGSAGADVICAGNGGSQLWGGAEADVLIGGDGADTFITGRTHGADLISNASTADNINLNDATLSDIVGTSESNGTISLSFNTGNVINVQSSEALSARFILADGSAYRYNHARKTWQSA